MVKGSVKNWNADRGYGFIISDEGDDIFVNANDLHISLQKRGLREGDRVKFDIKTDMKGDRAVNVRLDV
ncbi:cold-shock protein [Caldithrix abyssi]|uniref:Cold shock protein (Beta-ribbon, CspA family) n=1 Tax=Caldithrix abyssi DSM 13497 TaxID=880073 RepID=H1XY74_CALAY|nr:cold shock domain-containing protein [Caldithrix abyssi]APF17946.1 cold shock protein (beta-ribbon, CspA family) [Caldithrix abyssi DSM 13497]EHO42001.1 Cold-shock protein DNA-binding [Caldithrix abyssi DSM 13497]